MWLPNLAGIDSLFQTSTITVTADGTSHVKGAWIELVASVPFDVSLIVISTDQTHVSGQNTSQLTDIGVGASSDEEVLIANVPTGYSTLQLGIGAAASFPVGIPAGSRISARMQAAISSDIVEIRLLMYGGSSWSSTPGFSAVDTMGALTATSHGTSVGTSSINEIIASTAEDYKALGYGVDLAGADTTGSNIGFLEIFVGAGGNEVSLVKDIHMEITPAESITSKLPSPGILNIEMNIPAGSRLSGKISSGTGNFGIVLFGFR